MPNQYSTASIGFAVLAIVLTAVAGRNEVENDYGTDPARTWCPDSTIDSTGIPNIVLREADAPDEPLRAHPVNERTWLLFGNVAVTLHDVSERLDAGSIVSQKPLPVSISISASELEEWVAECGVDLFMEALAHHRRGSLTARPQDEVTASYFSYPVKRVA